MDGRHALVIANDEYANDGLRRLVAPAQDAAALADALGDPAVGGFDVRVVHNEPAQTIRVAVEEFFADRRPGDLLFLHFSCHGLKNAAGELFLAVQDTRPTLLASTAIAADFVNRQLADSRAQRIVLFLDCCYGGAFPRGMVVRAGGEAQVADAFAGQDTLGGGRGRVIVTASSAMEYAFEGGELTSGVPRRPSFFTSAVVDGLTTGEADADGDGWVGMTELFGFVTDRVRRATPHQNPQMWTFGAQGELMIARSRIRRIVPAPLPAELREAMDNPLAAARFGVAHELHDRLYGDDLGQAYAAWQALARLVDDDSRRVSDLARRFVAEGTVQVNPETLDLGTVSPGATVAGELSMTGPQIALTAIARTPTPWLQVEQTDTLVRVRATPSEPGDLEGSVVLQGPTGERTVTITVHVALPEMAGSAAPAGPPAPPEPSAPAASAVPAEAPAAVGASVPAGPAASDEPVRSGPRAPAVVASSGADGARVVRTPWWAVGVLALGAAVLVRLNWPGAFESRKAWYDAETDWRGYRGPSDPWILGSFLALAAALTARWSGRLTGLVLGLVAGGAFVVGVSGFVFLTGGISGDETRVWAGAALVSAVMFAVVLLVARPVIRSLRPAWPVPAALVVVGGVLHLIAEGIEHEEDGISFLEVTPLAVVGPLIAVAVAWPVLAVIEDQVTRQLLATVAATNAALDMVGMVPALTEGDSASHFLFGLIGSLLVLIGIVVALQQAAPAAKRGPRPSAGPGT